MAESCAAARGGHTKYSTSKWIKRVSDSLYLMFDVLRANICLFFGYYGMKEKAIFYYILI